MRYENRIGEVPDSCYLKRELQEYYRDRAPEQEVKEFCLADNNAFYEKICENRHYELGQVFHTPEEGQVPGKEKQERGIIELPQADCQRKEC